MPRTDDVRPAEMTHKELERLQQIEKEFNQFLLTQGKTDPVYLVAYSRPAESGAGGPARAR
ncbi:MAG: hypothetical protein AB1503_12945 [Bacillota bacterium]|nr:hypothetical protein [Bacillota bacterium]